MTRLSIVTCRCFKSKIQNNCFKLKGMAELECEQTRVVGIVSTIIHVHDTSLLASKVLHLQLVHMETHAYIVIIIII